MYNQGLTVWYNVSDVDTTKAFYVEKLGFECMMYDPEGGMVIIKTPTTNVEIGFSQANQVDQSSVSTVFDVDDIDEAMSILSGRGIDFIGEVETIPGLVKLATFQDPDGHSLMLAQSLSNG